MSDYNSALLPLVSNIACPMIQPIKRTLRSLARPVIRPLAGFVRRLLEEPSVVAEVKPVLIQAGPARDCTIQLPSPSQLATNICDGMYEPECIELLQKIISPTDICFDIGGHNGYFTLVLAKLAEQGRVICFEPVESLANRISESIRLSRINNAFVEVVAVAGESGQMQFRFAGDDSLDDSMGHLVRYGGVNTPRSQVQYDQFSERTVTAVTLDSRKQFAPNFIKIDAEGAEAEILLAGKELICQSKPRLLIELHGVDLALRCADLLGPLGYRAFSVGQRSLMMQTFWLHREDPKVADFANVVSEQKLPLIFSSRS
ncbi:MAG: FkbM family methyltransferase [Pirellulales bacterium]